VLLPIALRSGRCGTDWNVDRAERDRIPPNSILQSRALAIVH
jgi:hypothetical protein